MNLTPRCSFFTICSPLSLLSGRSNAYVETEIGGNLTLIDPSLAFWLEDEIADGAFIPFVFRGYEGARAHNVDYFPVESVELCEIVCGDLIDLIKQHPLPLSCFFNSAENTQRYSP